MNAADAARQRGDHREAERLLLDAVALGDTDSDLAALTLARLLERTAPARAASYYQRAVDLGLPNPLRRQALRKSALSLEAAGESSSAVWDRFHRAYPGEPEHHE